MKRREENNDVGIICCTIYGVTDRIFEYKEKKLNNHESK